jgi:hypothetical protein
MKKNIKFEQISQNEVKFAHMGHKFLLVEDKVGVYGIGRAVRLYQLDGLKKEFIKCIGWTKSDNHGGPGKDCITSDIIKFETSKLFAVAYIEKLLK